MRPKYLSVAWLSQFPQEEEKLCYGATFEISDIAEGGTNTSHETELEMFNMFQKTVSNQNVNWKSKTMVDAMVALIINQQNDANLEQNEEIDMHLINGIFEDEQETKTQTRFIMDHEAFSNMNVETFAKQTQEYANIK
eukprot:877359_1